MSGRSSSDSSAAISASSRCSAASSAAGAISTSCASPERALRERREPAQRLDLDVEEIDAHGAILGRRVDVQQAAASGELAAIINLIDALIAGGDELGHALVEVEQLADAQLERARAQRRIGHLLAQRDSRYDDDRCVVARGPRFLLQQRVERGDTQADEVRRRASGATRRRRRGWGRSAPAADAARHAGRPPGHAPGGRRRRRRASRGPDPRRPARRARRAAATTRRKRRAAVPRERRRRRRRR